jgi:hypothetical protein
LIDLMRGLLANIRGWAISRPRKGCSSLCRRSYRPDLIGHAPARDHGPRERGRLPDVVIRPRAHIPQDQLLSGPPAHQTIALDTLGDTYMRLAAETGIDPALMHRVAAIGSGTLDSLPHNGAVVTLLAVCGSTHGKSYLDIFMVAIVGALLALAAVILLGTAFGSF